MVQLSAAGLGVPTNNVGAGLSEAIRMGTQGFMQGAQLKMQQQESAAKQRAYEQALKEATWKLGQEQSQAQAQRDASGLIGQVGNYKPDANVIGPPTEEGLLPATAATHAQDFAQLQQHHADVMKQAGAIAGKLPPQYAQQFWNDIKQGMQQDALNLQRVHTSDSLHDGVMKGWFDAVDPATGERVPNETLRQQFSDLADRVRAGEVDPLQAQQFVDQTVAKINQEEGAVKHRLILADAASQKLLEMGPNVTPEALSMVGALRTGQIDVESWQKQAPYVLSGMVPNPRGSGWLTPQDAKLEQAKMEAEARRINAEAQYTESVKPVVALGNLGVAQQNADTRTQATDNNLTLGRERVAASTAKADADRKSREDIAANRLKTQLKIADTTAFDQARDSVDKRLKDYTLKPPMEAGEPGYSEWYADEVEKAFRAVPKGGDKKPSIKALLDEIDGLK